MKTLKLIISASFLLMAINSFATVSPTRSCEVKFQMTYIPNIGSVIPSWIIIDSDSQEYLGTYYSHKTYEKKLQELNCTVAGN